MTTVRELFARVGFQVDRGSVRQVENSTRRVSRGLSRLAQDFHQRTSQLFRPMNRELQEMNNRIRQTGQNLSSRLTLPLTVFSGFALKTAGDFEEAMNRVAAVTKATDKQFTDLQSKAKELGATTQFSATQAAEGMSFLAMAGLDVNQVMGAIDSSLRLAAAGGMDLAAASDIATNVLTQFQLRVEDLSMVNDVLAATASNSNTNVQQLGEAFEYAGSTAMMAGMSVHETAQFLGAFANIGVRASRAGTALSTGLVRIQQAFSKTGRMSKVVNEQFKAFGLSLDDFIGKSGEVDLAKLLKSLGQFGDRADFTGRIMRIFGIEAGRTLAALAKSPEMLDKVIAKTKDFEGESKRMAKVMMEGLPGAIKTFKSAFESLQIAIVDSIKPVLIPFVNALSGLMRGFKELQPQVKTMITVLGVFAATLGPLLIVLGGLKLALSAIAAGLGILKAAFLANATAALLLPAVIIGIVAAITLALDDLFSFMNGKPSLLENVILQMEGDPERIKAILSTILDDFAWFFKQITDGWKMLFDPKIMTDAFDGMVMMMKTALKKVTEGTPFAFFTRDVEPFGANQLIKARGLGESSANISPTVNVNVSNTNASPEQIGQAVNEAIQPTLQKTARHLRQQNEQVYEN